MVWVITLVVVQVVIAGVVIFVLKHLLDRELMEAAMEKLQAANIPAESTVVTVKSVGILKPEAQSRIQALVRRKSKDSTINFTQDVSIKGGIVIEFNGSVIDFSLANRLSNLRS